MRKATLLMLGALLLAGSSVIAGEVISLRFGFETPRTDSQYVGAEYMAKLVKEKSGGKMELKLFPDSVLGSGPNMLSQMRGGTLDIYMGGSGFFANMAKKLNILDINFLFTDTKHVDAVLDGPLGDKMLAELDPYDMKALAFWENGFRCLTNSRNAVAKADDVKGMKVRVPGMPMMVEAWKVLGTNPVPMPLSELFTALETKTVEGQEHPINVTYSAKLYEVQKFMSLSNHAYSPLIIAMNKKKFESLPADMQKVIVESAREAAKYQRKFVRDNIAEYVKKIAASGVTVTEKVDTESFRNVLGNKIKDMYLKEYGGDTGQKWLDEIKAMEGK